MNQDVMTSGCPNFAPKIPLHTALPANFGQNTVHMVFKSHPFQFTLSCRPTLVRTQSTWCPSHTLFNSH
eukprot:1158974-Pelagomonas_calceolata.AAC.6